MSTVLQENLADAIIANTKSKRPKNKKQLLVSSGYAEKSATSVPSKIIEQKGVQEALVARGFDVETAKNVVSSILKDDKKMPKDRLKAADMVFKVHGSYVADAPAVQGNTYNFFLNPGAREATAEFERRMREVLAVEAPKE